MHPLKPTLLIFCLAASSLFPAIAQALTCNGYLPMLSPYRAGDTIVEATAIRTVDNGTPFQSVEFHISRVFIGEFPTDTVVVDGDGNFDPLPSFFPIGSRNVVSIGGPNAAGIYGINTVCAASLSVVGDQVEGLIRAYDCPDHQTAWSIHQCTMPHESMPIDEFAELVTNYYASVQQAVQMCQLHLLPGCEDNKATFSLSDNMLRLPAVVVEQKQNIFLPPREDLELNNIVMELLGGEGGNLLFRMVPQ